MSISLVLKTRIKKRMNIKSIELMSVLVGWQASKSYNKSSKHFTGYKVYMVTSTEAILPTFPINVAFSDLWQHRQASIWMIVNWL
jgi:hypothetical protein